MTTETLKKEYTIDAKGKRLGTIATEAASILLGKKTPDYARHLAADVTLTISNVSKLDVTEKKKHEIYQSYSGYPGGRKTETLDHLGNRLGYAEVVRRTIAGMLPNNKLKKPMLKNLVITE
ncbi:50S ribosomal protein L13 [Candidatus Kaiserbacteria bacterium CG_4_9_14_0_2_um_filter_41_32]|uniref:50S ribosomal protein L13 n=1 Tax=Candidatus Kaiserbacteria bacterium CG_4_9_14_0_2_um_filter_41_32 TaxID=1974601 RepID=A0A2M8FF27_9BACT|nr:MAG: 50S ribosomal protein L13 [Candidatus Kaiserbacteria bacterium CG_4_9_14_0_2_um_filter_41_32]